jgi:hypothetical protein
MEKMILASEVLKNPSIVNAQNKFLMLYDQTIGGIKFDNMARAINLAAEHGWKPIAMTSFFTPTGLQAGLMYVILERQVTG